MKNASLSMAALTLLGFASAPPLTAQTDSLSAELAFPGQVYVCMPTREAGGVILYEIMELPGDSLAAGRSIGVRYDSTGKALSVIILAEAKDPGGTIENVDVEIRLEAGRSGLRKRMAADSSLLGSSSLTDVELARVEELVAWVWKHRCPPLPAKSEGFE